MSSTASGLLFIREDKRGVRVLALLIRAFLPGLVQPSTSISSRSISVVFLPPSRQNLAESQEKADQADSNAEKYQDRIKLFFPNLKKYIPIELHFA
jgi:hypothetical protein